jgi:hypothetical protein
VVHPGLNCSLCMICISKLLCVYDMH